MTFFKECLMDLMKYLQLKGRQAWGLVFIATFLTTIFAYGAGGHRAVMGQFPFFTPKVISKHLEEKPEIAKDLETDCVHQ